MNIRQERKAHNLTVQEVANRIGVTREAVSMIESGRRKPSYEVYCKLMSLFGYDVPRLTGGEADGAS